MEWSDANKLANSLLEKLKPGCLRIEVVGSVKRHDRDECGDIEILCIVDPKAPRPEFGFKEVFKNGLEKVIRRLEQDGILGTPVVKKKADGDKLKRRSILKRNSIGQFGEFCLELFIVRPETWAIQNVIRTGPRMFSHAFVSPKGMTLYDVGSGKNFHGLLPKEYQYVSGETIIKRGEQILDLKEERDAIELLGLGYIEPRDRWRYVK